jgi:cytidylate kinase
LIPGEKGRKPMIITVSRQMGSGGTFIGYQVAQQLGFSYLDREILRQAAAFLKKDEASLEEREEKSSGFIENFLRAFAMGGPEASYAPKEQPVYDRNLFAVEGQIIREMAKKDNIVIMGRGAFFLLRGYRNALHLFVHAPKHYRVGQVMVAYALKDAREAQAKVEESDKRRAKFIKDMTGVEWTDARNYHLSMDSSIHNSSKSVSLIVRVAGDTFQ